MVVDAINRHLAAMSIRPSLTAHDGAALSDYYLVGSRTEGTGLFALEEAESFDIL